MTVEGAGLTVERPGGCRITTRCLLRRREPATNTAHIRQPSSGLSFQVTVLETFPGVPGSSNVFLSRCARKQQCVLASATREHVLASTRTSRLSIKNSRSRVGSVSAYVGSVKDLKDLKDHLDPTLYPLSTTPSAKNVTPTPYTHTPHPTPSKRT